MVVNRFMRTFTRVVKNHYIEEIEVQNLSAKEFLENEQQSLPLPKALECD